jgi:hypothetical protein
MEKLTVEIDSTWAKIARSPLYFVIVALQGVSVTFAPLFLYWSGKGGYFPGYERIVVPLCFSCSLVSFSARRPGDQGTATEVRPVLEGILMEPGLLQPRRRTVLGSVRLGCNGGVDPLLGHFDDSWQLRLTFALGCGRILGTQQARGDPQSLDLFADSQQLLFFHS